MIICPMCNHSEYEGALFCSECGARLTPSERVYTQTLQRGDTGNYTQPPPPPAPLQEVAVTLYLLDFDVTFPVLEGGQVVLGRVAEGEIRQPDIDLSAFQAYQAGVSRHHALIRRQGQQLTITDLNSSNGTRVNGKRIPPNQPVSIHHGDVVSLGKLRIQILYSEGGA